MYGMHAYACPLCQGLQSWGNYSSVVYYRPQVFELLNRLIGFETSLFSLLQDLHSFNLLVVDRESNFVCTSTISVRVLSRSEAGARNAMSFAYAATFSFPSFSSSHMCKGLRHRLKIHVEMRLPCGVLLLVLNLFSPMLMQFYEYKSQISDQVSSFICVTSLTLWSILL